MGNGPNNFDYISITFETISLIVTRIICIFRDIRARILAAETYNVGYVKTKFIGHTNFIFVR
jgi:hypothetical protein